MILAGDVYYERPIDAINDLALLQHQISANALNEIVWLQKIQHYTSLAELPKAAEIVSQLTLTFPNQPVFQEAHMIILSHQGHHDQAIEQGEILLLRHPDYLTVRQNLARIYFQSGERVKGVNLLIAALEKGPIRTADWEILLRQLALATPDPIKLVEQLSKKAALHPEHLSLKYVTMVVCVRFGLYAQAQQILLENPKLSDHSDLKSFVAQAASSNP